VLVADGCALLPLAAGCCYSPNEPYREARFPGAQFPVPADSRFPPIPYSRFPTVPQPPPPGVITVTTSPGSSSMRHFAGMDRPLS